VVREHRPALILTFFLFALWGVGHRLYDTLVPEFAQAFALDSRELVLTQSAYSLTYFLIAIPAAIYARTFGSKGAIVFGLGAWCVGAFLFYPAALQGAFGFFLFAAVVMSCGYLFLEIGANPLVARMGPPETATLRLNFAHALYPVGVLIAVYVGRWLILSNDALPLEDLANAVVRPYMALGLLVLALAFVVDKLAFPRVATERGRAVTADFHILLAQPRFLAAMGAQVCNVAAMAGTWTLSAWYIKDAMPGAPSPAAADFLLATLVVFAIGRAVGAILMLWISPVKLLALFAASGLILGIIATVQGGTLGVYAMVASSFSVSIMFATILGTAIQDLGPKTEAGTALIYMGGAGSAIGVAAMHLVWTVASIQYAMLVPTLGYLGVMIFALTHKKRT
jgi:MFS transporter, FHS family, L-fucose permease